MHSWTDDFAREALGRLREDEKFLEACGIMPLAGSELEFNYSVPPSQSYSRLWNIDEFSRSGIVEQLKDEKTLRHVGEIVLGSGPRSHMNRSPRERYPSTIARATRSARQILEGHADKYGMDITFSEQTSGKRIRSLQSNISLWRSDDKTPLFCSLASGERRVPNELTHDCAQGLLQAQQAMSALVTADGPSFRRYQEKKASYSVSDGKSDRTTVSLRTTPAGGSPYAPGDAPAMSSSFYLEDRLASSEAEPALAMLITLGGIVHGVKTYMQRKGFTDGQGNPDPAKLKAHIGSPAFAQERAEETGVAPEMILTAPPGNFIDRMVNYLRHVRPGDVAQGPNAIIVPRGGPSQTPYDAETALEQLRHGRDLARDIMGKRFYDAFCAAYEREAVGSGQGAARER